MGFCFYHYRAYLNIKQAYRRWKEAYGELEWSDYIERLKKNEYTGQLVREVLSIVGDNYDTGQS